MTPRSDGLAGRFGIGTRLRLAFGSVFLLMLMGGLAALWSLHLVRVHAQSVSELEEGLAATLRLHNAALSFTIGLRRAGDEEDATAYEARVRRHLAAFAAETREAKASARRLAPAAGTQGVMLENVVDIIDTVPGLGEDVIGLARAGDWKVLRERAEARADADGLVSGLVREIDREVAGARRRLAERGRIEQRRAVLALGLAGGLSLAIAGLLGVLVTRSITRPLDRLGVAARAVARGEFGHELRLSGSHELAQLGGVFNQMAAELRAREERLLQSQKMEAVGQLAGGVAHDFNNLLTIINGYAHLLLGRLAASDPSRRVVEKMLQAGERAADLTRRLLSFSRKQMVQPTVLDLDEVVREAESMLRRLIGEHVELSCELAGDLGRIEADRSQLQLAIMNLALNARDAMPGGGSLVIRTANAPEPEGNGRVVLEVRDTGAGMDEETRRRAFDPFFTTKAPGKGTGLGLSSVYGIVRQSGGEIDLESEPGRGTLVRIRLPRVEAPATPEATAADPVPRGGETILVVEDDPEVRELIAHALARFGYRVLEAASGEEALARWPAANGFDLLVTDVVMGGLPGPALADRMRARRPDLRVLYISGYAEAASGAAAGAFLAKPFRPEALAARVREALAGAASPGRPPASPAPR
jgi:signal transduction histidine kinase/ActR/RegA family two-component response regulator